MSALNDDDLIQLTGAIDKFLIDKTGKRTPFVTVVFIDGQAAHCTNIHPPEMALDALKAFVGEFDEP